MNKVINQIKIKKKFILFTSLKGLVMVLGLITNIFIIRKLTVYDFGIFSIAFMFIGLITTFGFSWSSSSILYFGSKEKVKNGSINKTFWARNIIIAASLLITTALFILFKNGINQYIGINVTFLLLIWLYVNIVENYLNQYYLAIQKQLLSSLLSVTAKLIYLIFVLLFSFNVKTLIVLNIISHATVLLYIFGINSKDIGKFEFDKNWFNEILNFSLWQLFGFSGLYLINFGDTAVIKFFMETEDVGIYNAAYKLFNAIASFSFVISSYYASNLSEYFFINDKKNIRLFFYRDRKIIIIVSLVLHIFLMFFSKFFITVLYGERYSQAYLILNILLIGSFFRYLTVFYMIYYNTNKKYKLQQIVNIFRAIINILLDIVFIRLFGLIGPAIATTTAIFLTYCFSNFYCEKRIKKFVN